MSVSVTHSQVVYDALQANGIRLLSVLPETGLVHLVSLAEEDPEMVLVRLAKEEGVGVSAGAHLAGVKSAMLMQNHGLLESRSGSNATCAGSPRRAPTGTNARRRPPMSILQQLVAELDAGRVRVSISPSPSDRRRRSSAAAAVRLIAASLKIVDGSGSPLRCWR